VRNKQEAKVVLDAPGVSNPRVQSQHYKR